MLTDRDFKLLDWLKNYNAITIEQSQYLFFSGSYESARRRLSILEKDGIVKSYISKNTKQKIYYLYKKVTDKKIYVLDYLKELKKNNCSLMDIKIEPKYLNCSLKPDAFVKFKFKGYIFNTILSVNYLKTIDELKLNALYEKLAKEISDYKEFNNQGFILVIASHTPMLKYSSKNFESIYTDLKYKNLSSLLRLNTLL